MKIQGGQDALTVSTEQQAGIAEQHVAGQRRPLQTGGSSGRPQRMGQRGESSQQSQRIRPPQRRSLEEIVVVPQEAEPGDAPNTVTGAAVADALMRIETELNQAAARTVLPQLAAELVNEVRSHGPRAHRHDNDVMPAEVHSDLIDDITDEHIDRWFAAQGLSPEQVADLRKAAFRSGLPNPTGSFVTNALQFIAAPWLTHGTSNPWAGAGLGLATAAAAAPLNAAQQSAVVTLCESIREHQAHVLVPDKENINDKHRLPDLANALKMHASQLQANLERFKTQLESASLSGVSLDDPEAFAQAVDGLTAQQRRDLMQAAYDLAGSRRGAVVDQSKFLMTQGAHDRQWQGNAWQAMPRTMRAPVAGAMSMLAHARSLPSTTAPVAQTIAALALTGAQHWAAGQDELNKQAYNNKLNLLYGDMFTEEGKQALQEGRALTADDIDPAKLRGFIISPAQAKVKRATAVLKPLKQELQAQLVGHAGAGLVIQSAAGGTRVEQSAEYEQDMAALATLTRDLENLESGRISALSPDGLAAELLAGAESSVFSKQLWKDVAAKYTQREFSAQTAQRIGQMFHMGVLGSAVPSVMSKVVNAAHGGAKETPIGLQAGMVLLSSVFSGVGAASQPLAISVKNQRRETANDPGLLTQVVRGICGLPDEARAEHRGQKASRSVNEQLGTPEARDLLGKAEALLGRPDAYSTLGVVTIDMPNPDGGGSAHG